MALRAQELDLDELDKLADMNLDSPKPSLERPESTAFSPGLEEITTNVDVDDILPDESFSANPSPEGSLINGRTNTKPPISIFQQPTLIPEPVKPATPPMSPLKQRDRSKDDIPVRCSDIDDSPPMGATGMTCDEIPHIDNLDLDNEWGPVPEFSGLPEQFVPQKPAEGGLNVSNDKKQKKRKKKSKGVCPLPRLLIFINWYRLKVPRPLNLKIQQSRLLALKSFMQSHR